MQLRINSDRNIFDSVEAFVSFVVTIVPYPCVPSITAPALEPAYEYFIKDPTVPLQIHFLGMSNGECNFSTTLTNNDLTAIDSLVFTYEPEQL